MRKLINVFILLICLLIVSCENDITPSYGEVYLQIAKEKEITSTQMDVVSYYRYDAQLLSSLLSDEGVAEDEILFVQDGQASLGTLAQGRWRFTVRAYSPRNTLLYEGMQEMNVGPGLNSAKIVLSQHKGVDGFLTVDITTLKAREENPALIAEWKALDGSSVGSHSVWTVTNPDTEHVRYTANITIVEGRYALTLSLYGSTLNAQSITDLMIVGEDTTGVTGYINPGSDVEAYILVDGPANIIGAIETDNTPAMGVETTYRWVNMGDEVSSYVWSVNGDIQASTTQSMKYTVPKEGIYTISCIAVNEDGESGSVYYTANCSGSSWTDLGKIVHDAGISYGDYDLSFDNSMAKKNSGEGGRYLGYKGYVLGNGTALEPSVLWAPYVNGENRTAVIGTGDSSGKANTRILSLQDSIMAPHTFSGKQVVSLGGAYARLENDEVHIPSKSEMEYIRVALNNGIISIPDGLYWTSTEDGTQAWAMSVYEGTGSMTKVSKVAMANMLYVITF